MKLPGLPFGLFLLWFPLVAPARAATPIQERADRFLVDVNAGYQAHYRKRPAGDLLFVSIATG
jgi:hypothetical protein